MEMPMSKVPEVVHELSLHRFSSVETAAAAGLPASRLATRINEGRVPTFAAYPHGKTLGRGSRRTFGLTEVYALRVVEALASGIGIDVAGATAILDELRGVEMLKNSSDIAGLLPIPMHAEFEGPVDWSPQEWRPEWQNRDLAKPVFVIAARLPGMGWRARYVAPDDSIADALAFLPGTLERKLSPLQAGHIDEVSPEAMQPLGAVLINLTRELVAVDAALAPLLSAGGHSDD